ncbi:MAG: YggS family pyridoxal phosphate-dependent enzyme [Thermoguttaceae bacterium]
MPDLAPRIRDNLAEVRGRIAEAAARSGRGAESVSLIAVTKFAAEPAIRALVDLGCHRLGESRPQQLWERAALLAGLPIEWHMIGHLQRNKVRRTLPLIGLLQSCDNLSLIEAVDQSAHEVTRGRIPVLIEVNVSGDADKHGFQPAAVEPCLERLAGLTGVEVRGLMCMASLDGGLETARANFSSLRKLRDQLRKNCPENVRLDELSMGMSGDYEVAIEEGATIVRVGSALFEGIDP